MNADVHLWPPHPVISRLSPGSVNSSPDCHTPKSDIWSASSKCRSKDFNVFSFHISSRNLSTWVHFFCPQFHLFFNVRIKQMALQELNERSNSCCSLLELCTADGCCTCKQTLQMSRLCFPSQEKSYWKTVDFNDSHSFQVSQSNQVCSNLFQLELVPRLSFITVWLGLIFPCLRNSLKQDKEDWSFWLTDWLSFALTRIPNLQLRTRHFSENPKGFQIMIISAEIKKNQLYYYCSWVISPVLIICVCHCISETFLPHRGAHWPWSKFSGLCTNLQFSLQLFWGLVFTI